MKLLGLFAVWLLFHTCLLSVRADFTGYYPQGIQDVIPVKDRGANPAQENDGPQPGFDSELVRNVTVIATQTAFLHCKVQNLGHKAVSWIRQRDLHILTSGLFTYTSDQRFSVVQKRGDSIFDAASPEDWILQIKFVQVRDAGVYECQVSTEPRISTDFHLHVIESQAMILGPSEVYVKQGSTLSLTCVVNHAVENGVIFWYHDVNVLDHNIHRDLHINLIHDPVANTLTSRLRLKNVQAIHSGNYTCLPTAADPAFVIVHVINGEHPAAMQHGNSAISSRLDDSLLVFLISVSCVSVLRTCILIGCVL